MKETIRKYIVQEFLYGQKTISDTEPLFESGIIDSLGFIKLLAFIDKTFQVPIDMGSISMDKFATLNDIVQQIQLKKPAV